MWISYKIRKKSRSPFLHLGVFVDDDQEEEGDVSCDNSELPCEFLNNNWHQIKVWNNNIFASAGNGNVLIEISGTDVLFENDSRVAAITLTNNTDVHVAFIVIPLIICEIITWNSFRKISLSVL